MTRLIRLLIAAALLAPAPLAAQARVVNVANGAVAAAPALDSAISRLEDFLNRYPNSPLRPNALLQLGELRVRKADEEFAATQRATGAAPTDTTRAAANPAQRAAAGARAANAAHRPPLTRRRHASDELLR